MRRVAGFLGGCVFCFALFFLLVFPASSSAQDCEQWAARVVSVQGTVEVQKAGEADWQAAQLDDTYCPGDVVRVGANSRANLALANQSVLRLDEGSELTLQGLRGKTTSVVDLFKGAGHFFSRDPKGLEVTTPYTIAGVRGTEFLVRVEENQTYLSVFEGAVLAENDAGSLTLQSGQSAVAEEGRPPVIKVVTKPRDAVNWALYYPPVVYTAPGESPPGESDPRFYTQQASELLAVGRVREANSNIQQALTLDPNFADALALQTIIAVVQNEKQKSLELGQNAVAADANSATAHIALSYAQQANFDLAGARNSLQKAVAAEPENALAWARLAEIQMGFGRVGKALESAQKAVDIAPDLSRTQTVLGFAYLAQVRTKQAREAFNKAIQFDQADPLPRLGLGLAIIRDGNLDEGRAEIETAASLDPNNSLVRSYMGKAYYEEKRTDLAKREYEVAKELDPNDPTPWFYDAIAKQTTNRPVEALQSMQKAKELNDNRAVYRSKLQLDSDLAARSASQARIYNDLGFGQLGLLEGYNSVNADPTNYSAHRFLSDTYATLPRHEIARVSELLQSQLLQPLNMTPIQPQLAESNLFLISSSGAAQTSFNEFNPLFNRNGVNMQASGLYGKQGEDEEETWGAEIVGSAIAGNVSLSAGISKFETDGWRENADQEDIIGNIFAQWELTHKTSIQAEYRYRENERGDIRQRFFQEDFLLDQRTGITTRSGRLGFRHSFSPDSIVLGNFQVAEKKDDFVDVFFFDATLDGFPPPPLGEEILENPIEEENYGGELSYLFRSKYIDLVSGAGYVRLDRKDNFIITGQWPGTDPPTFIFSFSDPLEFETDHFNLYAYTYISPFENLTFTVGASGDLYDQEETVVGEQKVDTDQFNPKFGVNWNPIPSTTIRGAVFRTFTRTLITDQTLEPTQVAGFNQFFDDNEETDTWVYGVGLDQRLPKDVYFGAQFSYRDLTVPFIDLDRTIKEADWEEYLGRAYLNWTPHKWVALKAEYLYEKFERDEQFPDGIRDLETHRVPLGVNFFHPSGLSAGLMATYYDQKGTIERTVIAFDLFEEGSDQFWLVDAAIGYRFPGRYGIATLGVKNLFDEQFDYFETDRNNLTIQQARQVFFKLTLALP